MPFRRAGHATVGRWSKQGVPMTEPYTPKMLIHRMSRTGDYKRWKQGGELQAVQSIPQQLADDIVQAEDWPFPILRAVTETPCLRPDGSVLDKPVTTKPLSLCSFPTTTS